MLVTIQAFKGWLNSSNNMKLRSDASVLRLTYEVVANIASMCDFDKKSIENLPSVCENIIPIIEEDAMNRIAEVLWIDY